MTKTTVDLVGSSTAPCGLSASLSLSPDIPATEGYCIAVRVLEDKQIYNVLESSDGQFHTLCKGTTFVGTLGEREALKGYRGRVPTSVTAGDTLSVLNMGGIIGECTSPHPALGLPLTVEVLGAVVTDGGSAVCIQDHALKPLLHLPESAPIVAISGTAMDTGKTKACAAIIAGLVDDGYRVAAAKLTGASLLRDLNQMKANGAVDVASFSQAGVVSSARKNILPAAKAVLSELNKSRPDVIVVELGDGFIGHYGVDDFLKDAEIQLHTVAHVVAATDLAGAWAADQLFTTRYRQAITAMVGPVTDNGVGSDYICQTLGIAAHNAIHDPNGLTGVVRQAIVTNMKHSELTKHVANAS